MRSIDRIALNLAPLFLRLALGLTFLWAGAGKLFTTVELSAANEATLAMIESGVTPPDAALPPQGDPIDEPLPEPESDTPEPAPDENESEDTDRPQLRSLTDPSAAAPAAGYSLVFAQDSDTAADTAPEETTESVADDVSENVGANPVKRRTLVNVALTIHSAGHPEKGSPVLPAFIVDNAMTFAWAVAITEFVGGACIVLGFMTRLWAFAIFGVSTGIVWITGIGPAVMGGLDHTTLGFLPPIWPYNPGASMHFFWTLGLMLSAFSLLLLGAGALSTDRILFGNPIRRDDGVAPDDVS